MIAGYDKNLWLFSGYWGLVFFFFVGILLYKFRQRKRLLYGFLEVLASIATWAYMMFYQQELDAKLIGLLTGLYLMVRGLDNMRQDLPPIAHNWWDRWVG
ncbi:MAG: hypothetical protein AB7G39_08240 [Alphaproteobacteria bacterium]